MDGRGKELLGGEMGLVQSLKVYVLCVSYDVLNQVFTVLACQYSCGKQIGWKMKHFCFESAQCIYCMKVYRNF